MRRVRRFLSLQALLVWQGGFVFYAAVVVPIGSDVLGSAAAQGAISQRVAWWLNACGAAWAAVALWDTLADGARGRRLAAWAVAALGLAGQWLLHPQFGELYDSELMSVRDRVGFKLLHGTYLWLATFSWLASLAYCWCALADKPPEETP